MLKIRTNVYFWNGKFLPKLRRKNYEENGIDLSTEQDDQDDQDDQDEEKMIRTELMNISTKKTDNDNVCKKYLILSFWN